MPHSDKMVNRRYYGIFGSREGFKQAQLEELLVLITTPRKGQEPPFIITGDARGVDAYVRDYLKRNHPEDMWRVFKANWNTYGKKAGYLRNEQAVKFLSRRNGGLLLFWNGTSPGTRMNFYLAMHYGVVYSVYGPKYFERRKEWQKRFSQTRS